MWDYHYLKRIDFRVIPIILALMCISLLVISSYTMDFTNEFSEESVFYTYGHKANPVFCFRYLPFLFFLQVLIITSCANGLGFICDHDFVFNQAFFLLTPFNVCSAGIAFLLSELTFNPLNMQNLLW